MTATGTNLALGYFAQEVWGGWGSIQVPTSVIRLGDLLDFGQLFKAFGNN